MASSSDTSTPDVAPSDGITYYHKKFKIRSSLSVSSEREETPSAPQRVDSVPPAQPEPSAQLQRPPSVTPHIPPPLHIPAPHSIAAQALNLHAESSLRRDLASAPAAVVNSYRPGAGGDPSSITEPLPPSSTEEHAQKAAAAARKAGKYRCHFCGNYFAKPSVLDKHIRSHTNERPFSCSVCNYSFKTKSNFVKHCKTRKHAARSAGGDGGDLPSDEEVTDSDVSETGDDAASESDSHAAWELAMAAASAAAAARSWPAAEDLSRPSPVVELSGAEPGTGPARAQLSHSIDNIIGGSSEGPASSPEDRSGSPIVKGVVNHIDKVIQLNEAQLSWTKRALDNFGRHSTTLGRERETVRRVAAADTGCARRSSLYLPRPTPEPAVPALTRRSSVIGVEAQHELPAPPAEPPPRPGPSAMLRSSLSFPGPDELMPTPAVGPDSLVFSAMPSLLEARCVGCGLTHPGPCPLYAEPSQQGHILKRHLLQSAASAAAAGSTPPLKRRRLSSETARGAFEPVLPSVASGIRSPFEERKNLSYMGGGQLMVNDPNERRTYRVNNHSTNTTSGVGFYVTSSPGVQAPSRETSPQVMTIKSNLNSGGKMIEMSGSSDSSSGSSSHLGTPRLSGGSSAPPLQRNPFHFNQPNMSSLLSESFYPNIQAPNITPQLGPIMLKLSPSKTSSSCSRPSSANKRFCSPLSPPASAAASSNLPAPSLLQPAPVVAVPSTRTSTQPSSGGVKPMKKLTIKIPTHTYAGAASAGPSFPTVANPAPSASSRSPAALQPPMTTAPRRSPSRPSPAHVPHIPGMPGPYSQASDVMPRLPAVPKCPPPPPATTCRPLPKIQVQKAPTPPPPPPADQKPAKPAGSSLPRPSSLPLQPVRYNGKSQRGAALYSPETPRPRKAIQQQHMNGKCYTYINHKSSTKLYFCSVFQPQPNHVEQKSDRQVSMYSQWKHIEPPQDGVPVTQALGSLRLAVNRGSGGRVTFRCPDIGAAAPRLAPASLRLPRLAGVRQQENTPPVAHPAAELRLRPSPEAGLFDRCQCSAATGANPCPPGRCPAAVDRHDGGSNRFTCSTQRRLTAQLPARATKNGRPSNWPAAWDPGDRRPGATERANKNSAGSVEEMEVAEALVTFGSSRSRAATADEQNGPIDLSVTRAPPPPRLPSADEVLAPPAPPRELALMYGALSRLQRVAVQPEHLPSQGEAGQRYSVELQLSARQRRRSLDPDQPHVTAGTGAPVKTEPPSPPPPAFVPDELKSTPTPDPAAPLTTSQLVCTPPVKPAKSASVSEYSMPSNGPAVALSDPNGPGPMREEEIDVVSSSQDGATHRNSPAPTSRDSPAVRVKDLSPPTGSENLVSSHSQPAAPLDSAPAATSACPSTSTSTSPNTEPTTTSAPASSGAGMAAILSHIFKQVRHERASAGFAPAAAPSETGAGSTPAPAEPTVSASSLMHPNVTAGQPGLALTRPTARPSVDADSQRSDSSFFNRNSDRLVCTVCNKRDFVNRNQLSAHVKTHQMDQRKFRCAVCEVSFRSEQQLNKHRKSNDHLQKANIHRQFGKPQGDRRIYECLFCMRGFHNIGTLHKHFRCKTHIMGLENAGWLPCGAYAELEALGVPGHTDGADSINVEGTWPNYCHLQELSLTLLRDRPVEMAEWRRKFDEIRRGHPPRSYPFEIDPKLRGNADPNRARPQFPDDFSGRPALENGCVDAQKVALATDAGPALPAGGVFPNCGALKQEREEDPGLTHRLNGQTY